MSWSLWALAPLISLGAAFDADADVWASIRVLIGGVVPGVIFLASFINKNSYWRLGRFDWFCGGLSLAALVFWQLADSPLVAVLLATTKYAGFCPDLCESGNYPETESRLIFITSFLSAILIIPAIPVWTIANSAFQIGLMATTAAMLVAIYRKDFGIRQTI